jgi:hypothetical protein
MHQAQFSKRLYTQLEKGDTLYNTHYAIGFGKEVSFYLHIFNNKSKGEIEVVFEQKSRDILTDGSGTYNIKASSFTGTTYIQAIPLLTKKELYLKYNSNKRQHLICLEIMDFLTGRDRLHYKINN